MADLDDFFAKKDKKKSKKKFTTSDELAKKLDEKPVKKKERQPEDNDENQDEDEWKEVEEQTKDYTGLKIGQLTISEEDQMQVNLGLGYDGETDGPNENNAGNNANKGNDPWKKSDKPVVEEVKSVEPKTFVPTALRNIKRKGVAPDISNEEYFPSLGAEKPGSQPSKGFEAIKHGAKPQKQTLGSAPLSTENRFNSLSDNS